MNLRAQLILRLMQSRFYAWLLIKVIPYIRFTTYYATLRGWKYQRGYRLLQPGDIVLTTDKKKLTSLLISGEFTHAALCVDKGWEWEISEMTHTNYTKSTFFDLCKEADRVVIMRCPDFTGVYLGIVIMTCKKLAGAKYDTRFELGIASLYCSELVYQSDPERKLGCDLSDLVGIGRPYISPTGISQAANIKKVWDSDNEQPPY